MDPVPGGQKTCVSGGSGYGFGYGTLAAYHLPLPPLEKGQWREQKWRLYVQCCGSGSGRIGTDPFQPNVKLE